MYLLRRAFDSEVCASAEPECGAHVPTATEAEDKQSEPQIQEQQQSSSSSSPSPSGLSKGNFDGVLILVFVLILALTIYSIFGKWPRRVIRRWKKGGHGKTGNGRKMKSRGVQTDSEDAPPTAPDSSAHQDVGIEPTEKDITDFQGVQTGLSADRTWLSVQIPGSHNSLDNTNHSWAQAGSADKDIGTVTNDPTSHGGTDDAPTYSSRFGNSRNF